MQTLADHPRIHSTHRDMSHPTRAQFEPWGDISPVGFLGSPPSRKPRGQLSPRTTEVNIRPRRNGRSNLLDIAGASSWRHVHRDSVDYLFVMKGMQTRPLVLKNETQIPVHLNFSFRPQIFKRAVNVRVSVANRFHSSCSSPCCSATSGCGYSPTRSVHRNTRLCIALTTWPTTRIVVIQVPKALEAQLSNPMATNI